jgi:hypothetical protein
MNLINDLEEELVKVGILKINIMKRINILKIKKLLFLV